MSGKLQCSNAPIEGTWDLQLTDVPMQVHHASRSRYYVRAFEPQTTNWLEREKIPIVAKNVAQRLAASRRQNKVRVREVTPGRMYLGGDGR